MWRGGGEPAAQGCAGPAAVGRRGPVRGELRSGRRVISSGSVHKVHIRSRRPLTAPERWPVLAPRPVDPSRAGFAKDAEEHVGQVPVSEGFTVFSE